MISAAARDYPPVGLDLFVFERAGEDGPVTGILGPDGAWHPVPDAGVLPTPTLRIRDVEGRALLDALARYYQGAEDTIALRKDYDAERARVDRLVEFVARIATTSPRVFVVNEELLEEQE